ncbi:Galactinol--sucrose galactosyltransferase [Psidium guajava]|nr:Galactinol--sucrose galactosyltransferase [Psidium guajava]
MGADSPHSFIVSLGLKGLAPDNSNGSLRGKPAASKRRFQAKKRLTIIRARGGKGIEKRKEVRPSRGVTRCSRKIERRVLTLKTLIPDGESMGLEGLFRETAEYILTLEMRVKMMQMVVDMFSGSSDQ